MNKLLMMCPTRKRPYKVETMLKSFYETRSFADIVFYVSNDDPHLNTYEEILAKETMIVGDRLPIVSVFNLISKKLGYDYFGDINDDHVFLTKNWDAAFVDAIETRGNGWGCAYGEEPNTPIEQPSGCIISAKTIRALGYYTNPIFEHLFVDWYLRRLYGPLGLLLRCPKVVIEHRHWTFNKADIDDNYRELYEDKENYSRQEKIYYHWFENLREAEVRKLKDIIEGNNGKS